MNIAIDVLGILSPGSKNRGIGNYTTNQLRALFELDKSNRYYLLNFYENESLKEILNYSENVSEHYFYIGPDNFLGKDKNFKEIFGNLIKKFINEHRIDVFYLTSVFDGSISYDAEWFKEVKLISTLYDIIPYLFKDKYLDSKTMFHQYMEWVEKLISSDKILAISQSAKDDLIQHFRVDPKKVDVIYAGVDECFRKLDLSDDEKDKIRKRYSIYGPFIMCPAGDDERKNIAGVIEAYSKMPTHLVSKYQLVVVCKLSRVAVEMYTNIAKKNKVEDRVVFTNFVPTEDLVKLYNMAHVVAFPSKYEGFGLPVVEAMACGSPVLTSNNSSLGEIADGAAVLVDPFDVDDIARGMVEILENQNLEDLIESGFERVKQFQWMDVARKTLSAFQNERAESAGHKLNSETTKKKKIAFFTPLPPIESGISDYSVDLLNKLSNEFDIDVFIDDNYTPDVEFNGEIRVYPHEKFQKMKNLYDEIVFQMGNSEYHAYMIKYIQECNGERGVLVLHDANLHALAHLVAHKKNDFGIYRNFLVHDYDQNTVDDYISKLKAGKTGLKFQEMPSNGFVIKYVRKIIVHSDYAKKHLLSNDIGLEVVKIPHYVQIKDGKDKNAIREQLNIPRDSIVLAAFGHIHPTKRIMPIVKAFSELSKRHELLRLYLVGKPSEFFEEELNNYIKNNNLTDRIAVTGFVDLQTFEDYIDASDICFNLRYPYNGESSGSLMRILAKGKCAIVNDIGSFSEIPDDCCVKLPSPDLMGKDQEIESIVEAVEKLLSDPEGMKTMGGKSRDYAANELNINRVVTLYQNAIEYQPPKAVINENLLKNLARVVKDSTNEKEIYDLAHTLAYIKQVESV
jgi:glycosyltransferase involved in cell wall biosynthesis